MTNDLNPNDMGPKDIPDAVNPDPGVGEASTSGENAPTEEGTTAPESSFDLNPYGDPSTAPPVYSGEITDDEPPKKSLGTPSLVCGILSHVLNALCCLGFPLAIASIVLAIMDRSRLGKMSAGSLVGMILSISFLLLFVGILLYILFIFVLVGMTEGMT